MDIQAVAIKIHVIFILVALPISLFIFFHRKGGKFHRILGRCFWGCMFISSLATFGIKSSGQFSFIHLISIATLFWLVRAVLATRLKFMNWLHVHAVSMGSVFISIPIAGVGVLVRHYILPGNTAAGGYASLLVAFITVPILIKLTNPYKKLNTLP